MANRRGAFSEGSGSGAPVGRYRAGGQDWRYEKHDDGSWTSRYGKRGPFGPGSQEHANMEIAHTAGSIAPHEETKKPKAKGGLGPNGEPGLTIL